MKYCAFQCEFSFGLSYNFNRHYFNQFVGFYGTIQTFNFGLCSLLYACNQVFEYSKLQVQCKCLNLRNSDRFSISLYCNFLEEQILVQMASVHLQFMIAKFSTPNAFNLIRISSKISFHFSCYMHF